MASARPNAEFGADRESNWIGILFRCQMRKATKMTWNLEARARGKVMSSSTSTVAQMIIARWSIRAEPYHHREGIALSLHSSIVDMLINTLSILPSTPNFIGIRLALGFWDPNCNEEEKAYCKRCKYEVHLPFPHELIQDREELRHTKRRNPIHCQCPRLCRSNCI